MNAPRFLLWIVALGLATPVFSQTPELSKEVKADVKKVQAEAQFTPDFTVNYTNPKRWKSKQWLEVDVAFEIKKANVPGDTSPVVDSLDFKFFVGLNKTNKEGKNIVLTSSITYLNAMEREQLHAMAFMSPSALMGVLEKASFTNADIRAVGIEIYKGGALAGWHSSAGARWWEKLDAFDVRDGLLVPKSKTPFHPLWGDYDLETKQ